MLTKTLRDVFGKSVEAEVSTLRTVEQARRSQSVNPSINIPLLIVEETQYELAEVRKQLRYHTEQIDVLEQTEEHLVKILQGGTALYELQEKEKAKKRDRETA